MTALVARQPLHPLPMSATQRPPRRLSARLQDNHDAPNDVQHNHQQATKAGPSKPVAKAQDAREDNAKKRKNAYDEEDHGFEFTRVKKKKQQQPESEKQREPEKVEDERTQQPTPPATRTTKVPVAPINEAMQAPQKKRRNKMSFSTPNPKEAVPVRRSKRLSDEHDARSGSPPPKARRKASPKPAPEPTNRQPEHVQQPETEQKEPPRPEEQPVQDKTDQATEHSATKIALPFADTPVIRRNKAMRENKSGKGERRSSLGMRGRRASSLIETGNSNALPHSEVEIPDFYKHIESEGLPEPRRMRQLLTWCAIRSMDQKPMGAVFEDASAIAAARVIEEELLKELSNRSELSDWFGREDVPVQPRILPERPNPKNQQNAEKIGELEQQIQRLRVEKNALELHLRPPNIPEIKESDPADLDTSLLDDTDAALWRSLQTTQDTSANISNRLNSLQRNIGPAVDAFADGIHKLSQYRDAADNVAGRVLSMCSEKLAERDKENRRRAAEKGEETSPRRDLNSVLRGLSKVDR